MIRLLTTAIIVVVFGLTTATCRSSDYGIVPVTSPAPLAEVAMSIRAGLDEPTPEAFQMGDRESLRALYEPGGFLPLWVDGRMNLTPDGRESIAQLSRAAEDGLHLLDYGVDRLRAQAARIGISVAARDVAALDVTLSRGMLRYLHDLRVGRFDRNQPGVRLRLAAAPDFAMMLRASVEAHQIGEVVDAQRPPLPQYRALRLVLARYRWLEKATLEPLPVFPVLKPGDWHPGVPTLRRWLIALGDLSLETDSQMAESFDGTLVQGLKQFQRRHGLAPDGALGPQTQAALRVPLVWRIRQIEMALERLRWLPREADRRLVLINVPMFRLWAWDPGVTDDQPAFSTAVIVGRAKTTETPSLVASIVELIFRPYWNIPNSILRNEILPAVARNPDYLIEQDMEIVQGKGNADESVEISPAAISSLRRGAVRLRQRPGPLNALGLVKFVFANEYHVYLHATPAAGLFTKSRRDFSHGCVRVENAIGLAEWALRDRPEWTRDRIIAAMNGSQSLHVRLGQPISIVLFYATAAVMPDDHQVHFADDIYSLDQALDMALTTPARSGSPAEGTPVAE